MGRCIRLSLSLFIGILLSFNICFAGTGKLKYSMPPVCREGKVVCGENEKAVCLVFSSNENDPENNVKYITSCDRGPACIVEGSGFPAPDNVQLDCVEFAECKDDIAHCSDDKVAECSGNNEPQGCNCPDGSDPICNYRWEISNVGSDLH